MKHLRKVYVGLVGLLTLLLMQAVPASADPAALPNDVVGVGSDTTFVALDFLADGDNRAHLGFNVGNPHRRLVSVSPTGDARGRLTPLTNPAATVRLRAGGKPIVRPNGSGAGISGLLSDNPAAGLPQQINFARSSRMPTAAEQASAVANGWGGLHCYQFGTDGLRMAVSRRTATNAGTPARLGGIGLSIQTLVQLYSTNGTVRNWGDVPGYDGPTPNTAINPLLIQAGSGTRTFFDAQLTAANGGTPITFRAGLQVVEEHDPTPIMNDPNAIAPFSVARDTLLDSGYFDVTGQPSLVDAITLLSPGATAPTGPNPNAFEVTRGVFNIVRQSSVVDTTGADGIAFPWRGSSQNWVQALFAPGGGFIASPLSAPLIQAAGFTPTPSAQQDQGLCSSG